MADIPRPKTPLDETLWRDSVWYRQWGPLTQNTAMDYFTMSPFFDHTSNNGALYQQMQFNPVFRAELHTLELFNKRLQTMTGIEYTLAAGSQETGIWVVRKSLRKQKRFDEHVGKEVDDVSVLATYYIAGENVYQAPSIGAVLQNRMLTTITSLRTALSTATHISSFAPTISSASSQPTTQSTVPPPSTQTSTTSTPLPPHTTASASASSALRAPLKMTSLSDPTILPRALVLGNKYQSEYMDDHAPLLSDPGSLLQPTPNNTTASRGGTAPPPEKKVALGTKSVATTTPAAAAVTTSAAAVGATVKKATGSTGGVSGGGGGGGGSSSSGGGGGGSGRRKSKSASNSTTTTS